MKAAPNKRIQRSAGGEFLNVPSLPSPAPADAGRYAAHEATGGCFTTTDEKRFYPISQKEV
jgi:hypothetical protein